MQIKKGFRKITKEGKKYFSPELEIWPAHRFVLVILAKDLENSTENLDFRSQKFFSREMFPEANIILKETPRTITGNKCPMMEKPTKIFIHFIGCDS